MESTTNPTPNIHTCARCHGAYDWRRSTSRSLKMTYCGALCEAADLGFTIEALLELGHLPAPATAVRQPERLVAASTTSSSAVGRGR